MTPAQRRAYAARYTKSVILADTLLYLAKAVGHGAVEAATFAQSLDPDGWQTVCEAAEQLGFGKVNPPGKHSGDPSLTITEVLWRLEASESDPFLHLVGGNS